MVVDVCKPRFWLRPRICDLEVGKDASYNQQQTVGLLSFLFQQLECLFGELEFWSPTESCIATCKGTTAEGFASISLALAHKQDAMQGR